MIRGGHGDIQYRELNNREVPKDSLILGIQYVTIETFGTRFEYSQNDTSTVHSFQSL